MSDCVTEVEYCVTKGRNWEASVAFTTGMTEVIENPDDYEGVLVFRDYQEAAAPVYLTLRASIGPVDPDVPAAMTFTATPTQTAALPDWDIVAYCDLQLKAGGSVQRLFNAEVDVHQ
jgi:hypothetical protein